MTEPEFGALLTATRRFPCLSTAMPFAAEHEAETCPLRRPWCELEYGVCERARDIQIVLRVERQGNRIAARREEMLRGHHAPGWIFRHISIAGARDVERAILTDFDVRWMAQPLPIRGLRLRAAWSEDRDEEADALRVAGVLIVRIVRDIQRV